MNTTYRKCKENVKKRERNMLSEEKDEKDNWEGTTPINMRMKKSMKKVIEEIVKRDTHKTITDIIEEGVRRYLQEIVEREYKMSLSEFINKLKNEHNSHL